MGWMDDTSDTSQPCNHTHALPAVSLTESGQHAPPSPRHEQNCAQSAIAAHITAVWHLGQLQIDACSYAGP